jgi:hypothetical protein
MVALAGATGVTIPASDGRRKLQNPKVRRSGNFVRCNLPLAFANAAKSQRRGFSGSPSDFGLFGVSA